MAKKRAVKKRASAPVPSKLSSLTRDDKLREMARVNLAAAIILGDEAGYDKQAVMAAQFAVVLGILHGEFRFTPAEIASLVHEVFKPDA